MPPRRLLNLSDSMTNGYTQFVLDQLAGLGQLRVRRMFGGAGIYCDETFFAIAYHETLYLKVDDINRALFLQAGCAAFKPFPNRSTTLQYYAVPAAVLEESHLLCDWARGALAAARRLPAKKPARRLARQSG